MNRGLGSPGASSHCQERMGLVLQYIQWELSWFWLVSFLPNSSFWMECKRSQFSAFSSESKPFWVIWLSLPPLPPPPSSLFGNQRLNLNRAVVSVLRLACTDSVIGFFESLCPGKTQLQKSSAFCLQANNEARMSSHYHMFFFTSGRLSRLNPEGEKSKYCYRSSSKLGEWLPLGAGPIETSHPWASQNQRLALMVSAGFDITFFFNVFAPQVMKYLYAVVFCLWFTLLFG